MLCHGHQELECAGLGAGELGEEIRGDNALDRCRREGRLRPGGKDDTRGVQNLSGQVAAQVSPGSTGLHFCVLKSGGAG